jgi:hypothetical protein
MNVNLQLDWWPVGQGLFSSGRLRYDSDVLSWVFDCGTASADRHIVEALLDFGREHTASGAGAIGFAVLSHFDRDHVSGFERLVSRHPIRMVLLPYIPLWQRLLIAAEEGVATDDPFFLFFVDPARYLLAVPGQEIGQVVFVPASNPEDDRAGDGELPFTPVPDDGGPRNLKVNYGEPPERESASAAANSLDDPRVRYLARGGRLVLPFWEFVPYNDADLRVRADAAFLSAAEPWIQRLISPGRGSSANALKRLRSLYDRTFGKASVRRNKISLFLYSGPLADSLWADMNTWDPRIEPGVWQRFAQLSPGDGLLDTPDRLNAMIKFYGSATRMTKMGILQVMHHGAKSSWHPGVAERLSPVASVICSEPTDNRYKHPHADVLRDFWPHGAIQVDSVGRLRLDFHIYVPGY